MVHILTGQTQTALQKIHMLLFAVSTFPEWNNNDAHKDESTKRFPYRYQQASANGCATLAEWSECQQQLPTACKAVVKPS